ncbi:hypothetical protein EC396_12825 [Lutibacter sp. HS1-25]|nr:hypothetical protein EC396_14710 [Lutibacter sp. HS1-25]RXP48134.1 hypothetical protein EC396_12825 [Lutibacter sp. HS1-25]
MLFSIYINRSPHTREIEDSTESMTVQNIRHFQLDWKSVGFVVQRYFLVFTLTDPRIREDDDWFNFW